MKFKAQIMDELSVKRAMTRISFEIVERVDLQNALLVGIKTRGVPLAKRIKENILASSGADLEVYELDITHFRDDVSSEVRVNHSGFDLPAENKDVILVDDVLFTGRTTRAAIEAIMASGRAKSIRLAVLVDRGHRELPIRADFVGKNVPTSMKEEIIVHLGETDGDNSVCIYEKE
ncbi:MAG: bifunctional pyr operon transcriptional regulator/uracil phosphoribosyltransferase PyrR [Christensenellaceae bacterium]|nr:bifunctional pyr operon transcriptional regulator/uracil phosphoribosyltransferase PyrR [Christensenellaceae bacterium]MDY2851310.1 bifunctional pyr operon transcriptional regulator/uracil phosphoribosyltransferase PyrR [Christensenellaceae bacterium]